VGELKDIVARNRAARRRDVRKVGYVLALFALIITTIVLYECTEAFEPNVPIAPAPGPAHRIDGVQLGAPRR